jgi:hypothetical protein
LKDLRTLEAQNKLPRVFLSSNNSFKRQTRGWAWPSSFRGSEIAAQAGISGADNASGYEEYLGSSDLGLGSPRLYNLGFQNGDG